jgi:hypothetical protein
VVECVDGPIKGWVRNQYRRRKIRIMEKLHICRLIICKLRETQVDAKMIA